MACNEIREVIRENLGGNDMYGIYRLCPQHFPTNENDPLYLNKKFTMKKKISENLKKFKKIKNIKIIYLVI